MIPTEDKIKRIIIIMSTSSEVSVTLDTVAFIVVLAPTLVRLSV